MKTLLILLASSVLASGCAVTIGSCTAARWQGDGVLAKETRSLPPFERIEVCSSFDVDVEVGPEQSLEVAADSNLLERVTTRVRGDTLEITLLNGSYSFRHGPRVAVRVPQLTGLSLAGSGDVRISGLKGAGFELDLTGSGDVIVAGEIERLEAEIAGSGEFHLDQLQARHARVSITGSGDVDVHALESLDAHIAGSGDIRYRGRPATTAHVTGSGSVTAR